MSWFSKQRNYLHPENFSEIMYWSRKWGVTQRQLNEAIIDTGSTEIETLRAYLKGRQPAPGWMRFFHMAG